MALIDDVKRACARLTPAGWAEVLAQHGLDITVSTASALAIELQRELPQIKPSAGSYEV